MRLTMAKHLDGHGFSRISIRRAEHVSHRARPSELCQGEPVIQQLTFAHSPSIGGLRESCNLCTILPSTFTRRAPSMYRCRMKAAGDRGEERYELLIALG